jgi:CheY-like chemotaxis protein
MAKPPSTADELPVLIVDDDPDDLAILSDAFRNLSEGRWKIFPTTHAAEALERVKTGRIRLVLLALNSATLDVSLLLGSLRQPDAQFKTVVMAAAATPENRAAALAGGACACLEKPVSPEGLKAVFRRLSELAGWQSLAAAPLAVPSVALGDLVQMECLAGNSSVLELFREHSLGRIYLDQGQIVHAVCGEISGERAFQKLFTITGATFELLGFEPPPERTINRTWEYLLGEVAHRHEAQLAGQPEVESADAGEAGPAAARAVELLIASPQGEVLYQWQCADPAARVKLLQAIAEHAEPLAPFLQIGKLDRVETRLPDGRVILQVRADRLIFVRLANPEEKRES